MRKTRIVIILWGIFSIGATILVGEAASRVFFGGILGRWLAMIAVLLLLGLITVAVVARETPSGDIEDDSDPS